MAHISRAVRNCYRSTRKSSSRLLWASTTAIFPRCFNFQHLTFSKTAASTSQLRTYSGTSGNQRSSRESGSPCGTEIKPRHPYAGPIGRIRREIQEYKLKKWDFLIYRCDYSDDAAWNKFLAIVQHEAEDGLKRQKAEDLLNTMEMTVKEDKTALDGATVEQVRGIFNEWVQIDEENAENNNMPYFWQLPRYAYCVRVDADAIGSVVRRAPQPPERDRDEIGYATLIRLVHHDYIEGPDPCRDSSDDEEPEDDEEDEEDYTKMNDVKVPIGYLGPKSYGNLANEVGITWNQYVKHKRDDGVSCAKTPWKCWWWEPWKRPS